VAGFARHGSETSSEKGRLQIVMAPRKRRRICKRSGAGFASAWHRRAIGTLFVLLTLGFAGIAYAAVSSNASVAVRVVIGAAAVSLALWLAALARRLLR
jgi:hypothetical protein